MSDDEFKPASYRLPKMADIEELIVDLAYPPHLMHAMITPKGVCMPGCKGCAVCNRFRFMLSNRDPLPAAYQSPWYKDVRVSDTPFEFKQGDES